MLELWNTSNLLKTEIVSNLSLLTDFTQHSRDSPNLFDDHIAYEAYVKKHHKKKRKRSKHSNHRDLPLQAGPSQVLEGQRPHYDRHRRHSEVDKYSNYLEQGRKERSRLDTEKSSSRRQEQQYCKSNKDLRKRRNSSQSSHHHSKHSRLSESHETQRNEDDERRRYYLALAEKYGSAARQSSSRRQRHDSTVSEDRSGRHEKRSHRDVSSSTRESSTYREYTDRYTFLFLFSFLFSW